jgi:phospholipid N-methyltransferase
MLTPEKIQAMRDQLKTGIKTVSVPQLFPTPCALAERMVGLASINKYCSILESSAGTGRIIDAIINYTDDYFPVGYHLCDAIELNCDLVIGLKEKYKFKIINSKITIEQGDFLESKKQYDRIIMNPPFKNGIDITHINHAKSLLLPGGRLVALCANGPRQQKAFQNYYYQQLPQNTFLEEGTSVNTALVIIDN